MDMLIVCQTDVLEDFIVAFELIALTWTHVNASYPRAVDNRSICNLYQRARGQEINNLHSLSCIVIQVLIKNFACIKADIN